MHADHQVGRPIETCCERRKYSRQVSWSQKLPERRGTRHDHGLGVDVRSVLNELGSQTVVEDSIRQTQDGGAEVLAEDGQRHCDGEL